MSEWKAHFTFFSKHNTIHIASSVHNVHSGNVYVSVYKHCHQHHQSVISPFSIFHMQNVVQLWARHNNAHSSHLLFNLRAYSLNYHHCFSQPMGINLGMYLFLSNLPMFSYLLCYSKGYRQPATSSPPLAKSMELLKPSGRCQMPHIGLPAIKAYGSEDHPSEMRPFPKLFQEMLMVAFCLCCSFS
jgi:hypothetical protein